MNYTLMLSATLFLSCTKNEPKNENSINGIEKWVEAQSRLDTIYFESWDSLDLLHLNRGKEVRDDYLLPKAYSGPYNYSISGERISLNWMLSSNSAFNDYYFKINGNQMEIGNFYELEAGEILTFEKLE